jgi:hypothetical protein
VEREDHGETPRGQGGTAKRKGCERKSRHEWGPVHVGSGPELQQQHKASPP